MTQETAKEHLYSKLNEVKTNHDKALNVYGTQTMNEVLKIVDSYFENLPSNTDELTVEKLQEQLNTAKKHIEHVIGTIKHDGHLGTIQTDWILPYLEKALAAIGGDDD